MVFVGEPDILYIYSRKLYLLLACVIYLHIHAHEAQLNLYVRARALPNALPWSVLFHSSPFTITIHDLIQPILVVIYPDTVSHIFATNATRAHRD